LSNNLKRVFEERTRDAAEKLLLGVHGLGGDVAREEAVDVNGGGALLLQSPCKLPREEDVGQLAVAISSGAVE
jgi:hypothetical protein